MHQALQNRAFSSNSFTEDDSWHHTAAKYSTYHLSPECVTLRLPPLYDRKFTSWCYFYLCLRLLSNTKEFSSCYFSYTIKQTAWAAVSTILVRQLELPVHELQVKLNYRKPGRFSSLSSMQSQLTLNNFAEKCHMVKKLQCPHIQTTALRTTAHTLTAVWGFFALPFFFPSPLNNILLICKAGPGPSRPRLYNLAQWRTSS